MPSHAAHQPVRLLSSCVASRWLLHPGGSRQTTNAHSPLPADKCVPGCYALSLNESPPRRLQVCACGGGGYGGFDERPRHSKGTQAQHGVGFFACCSVAGSRMLTPGMLARPAPFPPAGDPGEQAALTPPHLGAREGRRADACSNAISSRAQRRHAIARFLPSAVHVRRGVRWLC